MWPTRQGRGLQVHAQLVHERSPLGHKQERREQPLGLSAETAGPGRHSWLFHYQTSTSINWESYDLEQRSWLPPSPHHGWQPPSTGITRRSQVERQETVFLAGGTVRALRECGTVVYAFSFFSPILQRVWVPRFLPGTYTAGSTLYRDYLSPQHLFHSVGWLLHEWQPSEADFSLHAVELPSLLTTVFFSLQRLFPLSVLKDWTFLRGRLSCFFEFPWSFFLTFGSKRLPLLLGSAHPYLNSHNQKWESWGMGTTGLNRAESVPSGFLKQRVTNLVWCVDVVRVRPSRSCTRRVSERLARGLAIFQNALWHLDYFIGKNIPQIGASTTWRMSESWISTRNDRTETVNYLTTCSCQPGPFS